MAGPAARRGLSLSIGISPRESLAKWRELVVELERRDVDSLWLIDSQIAMKDVYVGLTVAALATTRMRLAAGVTNCITRHPTVTASATAALADLAPGRVSLGLGAGDSALHSIGHPPSTVAEMAEALGYFRSVLSGREGTWQERSYPPAWSGEPIGVYLAVSQRRMCNLAGRLADGAIIMGPADPEFLETQVGWIRAGLEEAGRDRGEIELLYVATTSANSDQRKALDDVSSWASAQARLLADFKYVPAGLQQYGDEFVAAKESYDYAHHLSTHAEHRGAISEELTRRLAVVGSAEDCSQRLEQLRACGIDGFIFPLMGGGRLERVRVLQEEILASPIAGRDQ
ncbi:MAG TPA: LLM class flavin-dependent oxidoreductase [Candidatus Dormibacteraeota bacterium]